MTIDDHSDTRSEYGNITTFCSIRNINCFVAKTRSESEQFMRDVQPDMCFVAGWYWLIDGESLKQLPRGAIGVHNSLLPKYRGGSPLVWAMINGEPVVGVSLFSLVEEMDAGPIWAQRYQKVEPTFYIENVLNLLEAKTLSTLRDCWPRILDGTLTPVPQDHRAATFCAQRYPEDGLIDWDWSAERIYNFVRAQSVPYPGSFTYLGSNKLTIWRAHPLEITYYGTPGQVARILKDGVYVICGDHHPLVLESVTLGDDPSMKSASEVIKSIKTRFK